MGLFLCFGALMSALAGITLLWRGTILDRMWVLNLLAYQQLTLFGRWIEGMFLLLSAALAIAARGWFLRRRWGWALAVAIITIQVLGDLVNAFRGDLFRGGFGFLIAAALLLYLLSSKVRTAFRDVGPIS